MSDNQDICIFEDANDYIQKTNDADRAKILAQMKIMSEGDHAGVLTKQLSGPIRELIVKQHRIVYFLKTRTLYFITAFKKQSAKTPKRIIDNAKQIFKNAP